MNREANQLVQLWWRAMDLKNIGEWLAASEAFGQILKAQPDWEHGYGAFNLAECYEELGRISEARSCYEAAPRDRTILGGYASFLFQHGEPLEAFERHRQLYSLEKQQGDSGGMAATMIALRTLGARLGWGPEETKVRIENGS